MRDRRRCAACGVGLPVDAARCPTCGHAEGDPVVAARDRSGDGPSGRRRVLIVLAAVLALVGVLAVVDERARSDGDETAADVDPTTTTSQATATSRRSATPTTPPERTFEPTIDLAPGERLLGWVASGWGEVLDPVTGTIRSSRLSSGAQFVTPVPRLGGVVTLEQNTRSARWFPELPLAGDSSTLASDVDDVFASEIDSRVWVVQDTRPVAISEVDVATGEVVGPTELPVNAWPRGPIDGGLVITAPDGLWTYSRGSDRFERIVSGEYVASSGRLVAYRSCDDRLECPVSVLDVVDRTTIEMEPLSELGFVMDGSLSPDGRWLAVVAQESFSPAWRIVVFDLATGRSMPVTSGPSRTGGFIQVAWSLDGEWLVWPDFPGVRGFHPADNTAALVDTDGAPYLGVAVLGPRG